MNNFASSPPVSACGSLVRYEKVRYDMACCDKDERPDYFLSCIKKLKTKEPEFVNSTLILVFPYWSLVKKIMGKYS